MKPNYKNNNEHLSLGKMPPQAQDLEVAILGNLMIDKDAILSVIGILKPEGFYKNFHQIIYSSIVELFNKRENIDILTVSEKLRKMEKLEQIGGPFYLTELTKVPIYGENIISHSKIIMQKYLAREMIRLGSDMVNHSFDESQDIDDVVSYTQTELFKITSETADKEPKTLKQTALESYEKVSESKNKKDNGQHVGIPTGDYKLDKVTGGWQGGNLYIIAARPGQGKTSKALDFAKTSAQHKYKTMIFSLEMSKHELNVRLFSSECDYTSSELRNGTFKERESVMNASGIIANLPIIVDDQPQIDINELCAKARSQALKNGVDMIIVDYLQIVQSKEYTKNREREISHISASLKGLAKELNVPVIALSQLSRDIEKRKDKMPMNSDLRESGAIEQDADFVSFLYRPSEYGIKNFDHNGQKIDSKGLVIQIITKNRHGYSTNILQRHNVSMTKFEPYFAEEKAMFEQSKDEQNGDPF